MSEQEQKQTEEQVKIDAKVLTRLADLLEQELKQKEEERKQKAEKAKINEIALISLSVVVCLFLAYLVFTR